LKNQYYIHYIIIWWLFATKREKSFGITEKGGTIDGGAGM
jgi:hypothetical protein